MISQIILTSIISPILFFQISLKNTRPLKDWGSYITAFSGFTASIKKPSDLITRFPGANQANAPGQPSASGQPQNGSTHSQSTEASSGKGTGGLPPASGGSGGDRPPNKGSAPAAASSNAPDDIDQIIEMIERLIEAGNMQEAQQLYEIVSSKTNLSIVQRALIQDIQGRLLPQSSSNNDALRSEPTQARSTVGQGLLQEQWSSSFARLLQQARTSQIPNFVDEVHQLAVQNIDIRDRFRILLTFAGMQIQNDSDMVRLAQQALTLVTSDQNSFTTRDEFQALITLARIPHNGNLVHAQRALSLVTSGQSGFTTRDQFEALIILARIPHDSDLVHAQTALRLVNSEQNSFTTRDRFEALIALARIPGDLTDIAPNLRTQLQRAQAAHRLFSQNQNSFTTRDQFEALIALARIPHGQPDIARVFLAGEALRLVTSERNGFSIRDYFNVLITLARIPHDNDLGRAQEAHSLFNQNQDSFTIRDRFEVLMALARIPRKQLDANRVELATQALNIVISEQNGFTARDLFEVLITLARIPHDGDLVHAQAALRLVTPVQNGFTVRDRLQALMILAKIPHNNGRLDCAQEALELARRLSDNRLIQEAERIIQNPNQREMGTRLQRPSSGNAQQVGAAAAAAAAEQNSPPQGFYQGSDGYWYHPGFRGVPFIVAVDGYFRHPNFPQLQLFSDAITGQVFYWYFNQTTGEWLYCPWNHGQR